MKRVPNFLYIGTNKSGSTCIYNVLKTHKEVYLPTVKELFYYDHYYHKGDRWYARYFRGANSNHKVIGEFSHDYLYSEAACRRIAHDLPDVKLIVCLREPSDRAYSAYRYMLKQGRTFDRFDTALEKEKELVEHGLYSKYLARYLQKFGTEKILIVFYDDLKENPQLFFEKIFSFLDIESIRITEEHFNDRLSAAKAKYPSLVFYLRSIGKLARNFGRPEIVSVIKNLDIIKRVLYEDISRNAVPEQDMQAIERSKKFFNNDVRSLDNLLGTELYRRWNY